MRYTYLLSLLVLLFSIQSFAAKQQPIEVPLLETKHFLLYSNPTLNEHLFLYEQAGKCKQAKIHNDSLAHFVSTSSNIILTIKEKESLNRILRFYKDSLLNKDLLFDKEMRYFSDVLVTSLPFKNTNVISWQKYALNELKNFNPVFMKAFWPSIDSVNKVWINMVKADVVSMEESVTKQLTRAYETPFPEHKVRIDITVYATWAGGYTYADPIPHITIASTSKSNQGQLGVEVLFHEASHLLNDKMNNVIIELAKDKEIKGNINLWHNIMFYTTGYILTKEYQKQGKTFTPFYVELKFEQRFTSFKVSTEACKLYWNKCIDGETTMKEAMMPIMDYVIANNK